MQARDKTGQPLNVGSVVAVPRSILEELVICTVKDISVLSQPGKVVLYMELTFPLTPDGRIPIGYKLAATNEEKSSLVTG